VENAFLDVPEPENEPWCLAFSNTVGGRNTPVPSEHLKSAADVKSWLLKKEILLEDPAGAEDPKNFERAIRLRQAIYNIGSAIAKCEAPSEDDLSELNWNVQRAIVSARLETGEAKLNWNLDSQRMTVAGCLGLIALSAAGLFTGSRAQRIRECGNHTCGWLFLDFSKNHSRKWCDMSDCGNVAKARRYYARQKAKRAEAALN
jgi:predicted RNA-binding Zn ribbon-like protein